VNHIPSPLPPHFADARVLFVDGPVAVAVRPGTFLEIMEALQRITPLVRIAAIQMNSPKEPQDGSRG
jgi:hypothetical protein